MIMTFDNTVAAKTFMTTMTASKAARFIEKGRNKWLVQYSDHSPNDYLRVKHS